MKQIHNHKEYMTAKRSVIKSVTAMRDNLQAMLVFGFKEAAESGNLNYLTDSLQACIGVKALPTQSIKEYIKAHVNVKWVKRKDKTYGFAKDGALEVQECTIPWYSHETAKHQATADLDPIAQAKAFLTRLTKAIEGHTVKEGEEDHARTIQNALKSAIAA